MDGVSQSMPFSMPMFRSFVPGRIRPWIYVFIAVTFQFSGGLYLGTMNRIMGETALMREDILMCILLLLLFLLYDAPVRRKLKQIPAWQKIRNLMT